MLKYLTTDEILAAYTGEIPVDKLYHGNTLIYTASSYPAILNDGNTVGWYLADDLTTITKDGSNFVSRWNDKLGSGHDLLQATGSQQPLWVSPDYIQFDGIDNSIRGAFTWNQPCCIYLIFKQITWTSNDSIIFGVTAGNYLNQRTASPLFRAYAGVASGFVSLAIGTWGIVRLFFNGATSKLQVNNGTAVTGNFGTNPMGGIIVGATTAPSAWSNIKYKEIICRKVVDASGDETDIYNYLVTRIPV